MPQLVFSPAALRDLERLKAFLQPKSPDAARRAAATIIQSIQIFAHQPRMGRPVENLPDLFREWIIKFGSSAYIARYHYAEGSNFLESLAVRHAREAGFSAS